MGREIWGGPSSGRLKERVVEAVDSEKTEGIVLNVCLRKLEMSIFSGINLDGGYGYMVH